MVGCTASASQAISLRQLVPGNTSRAGETGAAANHTCPKEPLLCLAGLVLLFLSLVSFGKSFRVGIDQEHPDKLITAGVFVFSRNPIYVAFALVLLGQFLVFPMYAERLRGGKILKLTVYAP